LSQLASSTVTLDTRLLQFLSRFLPALSLYFYDLQTHWYLSTVTLLPIQLISFLRLFLSCASNSLTFGHQFTSVFGTISTSSFSFYDSHTYWHFSTISRQLVLLLINYHLLFSRTLNFGYLQLLLPFDTFSQLVLFRTYLLTGVSWPFISVPFFLTFLKNYLPYFPWSRLAQYQIVLFMRS
jgi:hypothetical protein